MRWIVLGLLASCAAPPTADRPTLPETWVESVVREPARFEQLLTQTSRDGWVALHAHRAVDAWQAFDGPTPVVRRSRARAAWELGRFHEVLARLHVDVETAFAREAMVRGGETAHLTLIRDTAATCLAGPTALGERAAMHEAARTTGDPSALMEAAAKPILQPDGDTSVTWFDPCLHSSLAAAWDRRALDDLDATRWPEASAWVDGGLESSFLGAWLDRHDLRTELAAGRSPGALGALSPTTRALGVPDRLPGDLDAVREEVRALDEALQTWRARLGDEAPAAGLALESELGLLARFRQEWLLARATLALEDDQHQEALLLLELAHDVTEREVGAANGPRLFALLAAARFAGGRDREALDALHPLSDLHPEVLGLRERLGDLTVLRSLTRTGDSKEN